MVWLTSSKLLKNKPPLVFKKPEPSETPIRLVLAFLGGGERDRTDDPLLAKQVLSQLSYTPGSDVRNQESVAVVSCTARSLLLIPDP